MGSDDRAHTHSPEEERRIRDAALDQTIAASFPASDPPSSNPNPDDHNALESNDDSRMTDSLERGERSAMPPASSR